MLYGYQLLAAGTASLAAISVIAVCIYLELPLSCMILNTVFAIDYFCKQGGQEVYMAL